MGNLKRWKLLEWLLGQDDPEQQPVKDCRRENEDFRFGTRQYYIDMSRCPHRRLDECPSEYSGKPHHCPYNVGHEDRECRYWT